MVCRLNNKRMNLLLLYLKYKQINGLIKYFSIEKVLTNRNICDIILLRYKIPKFITKEMYLK